MTESLLRSPADPTEEGINYGGFADIARRLNALHPERSIPFSRQLVERWYKCRGSNGFPERQPVQGNGGKVKELFDLVAVERWHIRRCVDRPPTVRQPEPETIPLFHVDQRGHPVDAEQGSYRGHPEARGHHSEVRESYRSTSILDL